MRILVACEESQAVTKRLRLLGHEAYSCDILECSGGHPEWHIKDDVIPHLRQPWDMVIAFPPCTHLASSGARWFEEKRKDGRQKAAIDFFMACVNANAPRIAVENPVGIMSSVFRKPSQIVQPWQFGDEAQKTTCLWLKRLPPLRPTSIVGKGEFYEFKSKDGKNKRQPMWYFNALRNAKTASERSTIRSKTFPGIADAMARQWTDEQDV